MNIYEELINGIAAIGMDIDNLLQYHADMDVSQEDILQRMRNNQHKVRQATILLAEKTKAVDDLLQEIYPTAYWHRQEGGFNTVKHLQAQGKLK